MHSRAAAETPHRVAELGIDERVDDNRCVAPGAQDRSFQISDGLGASVAHLLELLFGKLRLQCLHEPRGGLPGGIGDDVQLDSLRHRARG